MASPSNISAPSMHSVTTYPSFRADKISVILKFGFQQRRIEYPINDVCNSIIKRLYEDAESWLRILATSYKNEYFTGSFTIYLFRILVTEFTMVPVMQPSDIEQNSIIEIVLAPAETSRNAHDLYRSQLNKPTNCSKCSRFIVGLYKQGFRCRKCRMTFHQDCASFLLDDCPVQTNFDIPQRERKPSSSVSPLRFRYPSVIDSGCKQANEPIEAVPIFRLSIGGPLDIARSTLPNAIIDKGIFPACIRGTHFCQRYLFCLTTNVLSISPNLSADNVSKQELSSAGDADTVLQLVDISNLVLTHLMPDRDDVFEIHLQNNMVLSVGKRTDTDGLQMETAQFYSSIRYTRETLITTTASLSPSVESASVAPSATEVVSNKKPDTLPLLSERKSIYAKTPFGEGNEGKDLHEFYRLTNEKLGEGAFGRVMKGYRKSTNHEVAVKIMEKANCSEQVIRQINGEITNLCKFNHPNILKLEAYFERDVDVCIVTERMETDLCSYITSTQTGCLDEDICRMLTYQVIVALRYLHGKECGHLDVKCDNILVTCLKAPHATNNKSVDKVKNPNQDFPLVKLADFGYSRIIGEHSFRKTHVGTRVYNAPEIYHSKEGYNRLADMWSVGIVLYAALSGTLPFDEKNSQRAEEIVRDKKTIFSGPQWKTVSNEAINLLSNHLLVVKLDSRMNPNDALFHSWFTDFKLYEDLREIERRTRSSMKAKGQESTSQPNWLTREREDLLWMEFQRMYAEKYSSNK
ncbi:unnamed protein product [Rotaria socialis]|uniref:Protein kinase C n=1 Tax=Rotaria socialis TaxID=392032 RepID=A0A820KJH2_9BILA|nr:unnamed protein product [Rotaria socialis]CAF3718371.1 unnamed protein product [Rotaria socialis]CAF4252239.1 unnamed protein product [Rotaria socialis]CAF4343666.1 unnamed protein product [Rotaria socialis]